MVSYSPSLLVCRHSPFRPCGTQSHPHSMPTSQAKSTSPVQIQCPTCGWPSFFQARMGRNPSPTFSSQTILEPSCYSLQIIHFQDLFQGSWQFQGVSHSYSYRVLGPLNTETQQTNKQHHPVLTNHKTTTGITGVTRRSLNDLFQRVNPSHPARNTSSQQAYRRKKTLATRAKNPDTSHRRKKNWLPMQKTSSPKCLVYIYIYSPEN